MDRPKTTPYIIEPILFGRDTQKKSTVECIVNGEYSENKLTVLPIVGPGVLERQLSHNTYTKS
jgi:hypothetical protein